MNGIRGNVIVGQSGGPTAVINSSLAGVFKTAKDRGANKVYGMLHGIQGLLQERYVDLEDHIKNDLDIELLKRTPSAYLGSCRFKLRGCQVHTSVMLSNVDIKTFKKLGVQLTSEPVYEHNKLYH
jgi:6-phosphofructokinase